MILLNNNKFADKKKEFISNEHIGYCKPCKRHIKLFNSTNDLIGVITCHKVLALATKQDDGKYWYSYGDIEEIGRYEKYSIQSNDIETALKHFNIN